MKLKNCRFLILATAVFAVLNFNSCIGLSMDIQMNRDGSGKLTLEYRLSRLLENLGKLDGNELMPSVPVGRADFERTIDRIPGMKISSFSVKDETKDTVYKAVLDFDNEKALLQFLNPYASITRQGQSGTLKIILFDQLPSYDQDMMELIAILSNDYDFSVSFSAPSNSTLTLNDAKGNSLKSQNVKLVPSGRKVSFSIGIMDTFELKDGLNLIFNW